MPWKSSVYCPRPEQLSHLDKLTDLHGTEPAIPVADMVHMFLHNEHLNREFKDDLNTFRSNITDNSITRSSQSIGPLSQLMRRINSFLHVHSPTGVLILLF